MRAFCWLAGTSEWPPDHMRVPHRTGACRRRQWAALLVPRHLIAGERCRQGFLRLSLSDRQLLPMAPGRPGDVQQRAYASHVAARDAELLADLRHRLRPDQGIE